MKSIQFLILENYSIGFNMSNITQALDKIVRWQRATFPEQRLSFPCLRSGLISLRSELTRQQIEEMTSNFPFKLTKELYELYLYKGKFYQDKNSFIELTPDESLLSFENALRINKNYIEYGDSNSKHVIDFHQAKYINALTEYKFEIGYGFGKETYYVVCEEEEKDSSPVWVRFIADVPLMFSKSLTLWILTIAEGYETGGYYVDKDGYFDVDYDKMKKIFYKYNPELSETWKYIHG